MSLPRAVAALCAAVVSLSVPAAATEQIWSTGWSNMTTVQSQACGSPTMVNEAADDFELVGLVERVYVTGYNSCVAVCFPPPVTGAWVRFYAWTAAGPGALQAEFFVPAGPGLALDPTDIQDVDVTLPKAFLATGRHYVSVQLVFDDCFYWAYWVANPNAPIGGPAYARSNGGAWTQVTAYSMSSSDLSFRLFGSVGPPVPPQGCGVWTEEPSPGLPGANESRYNAMAVLAPDDIWAVGRGYVQSAPGNWDMRTLAAHFDGQAWAVVPTPDPAPVPELTYCELDAVAALAPNDVWAAGTRNDLDACGTYVGTHNLVLHWDGAAWTQMDAPQPTCFGLQGVSGDGIYDILALAPDDVWFLGEWIDMNAQSYTTRHALAMHWDGSSFTVDKDFPVVGSNGATIYASDAWSPDDIWAVGAEGDGDPAAVANSMIFHWDGTNWEHRPAPPVPGYWYSFGGVKVLAPDDVWISGSSWAPPNQVVQFMLHWNGSSYAFIPVPYAGGPIVGDPPAMYVFGSGGVSVFDGASFADAHLLEGLEALASFGFSDAALTGPCEMIAVGQKIVAGDQRTLVARLGAPSWSDLGAAKPGAGAPPEMLAAGSLAASTSNTVALTGAPGGSLSVLVAGLSAIDAPFKGGTLVPHPQFVVPLAAGASGALSLPFTWPAMMPAGTEIYLQFWVLDPGATLGFSASNALRGVSH